MSTKVETAFLVPEEQDPDVYATLARDHGADEVFDAIIVRPGYDELDARERSALLESTDNPDTLVIASAHVSALDFAEQSRFHTVDEMDLFEQIIQNVVDERT